MIEDNNETAIYQQLAELKLQNTLLSQRLDMMTRMVVRGDESRAELCQQLAQFDLVIAASNEIIRTPSK